MDDFLKQHGTKPFWDEIDETERLRDEVGYLQNTLLINANVENVLQTTLLQEASRSTGLTEATILTDIDTYLTMHGGSRGDNRFDHIMRHFDDFVERLGATEPLDAFEKLQEIALNDNPSEVAEFRQDDGQLIKYDIEHKVVIVLNEYDSPPPDFSITTAYGATAGAQHVVNKIIAKTWLPA